MQNFTLYNFTLNKIFCISNRYGDTPYMVPVDPLTPGLPAWWMGSAARATRNSFSPKRKLAKMGTRATVAASQILVATKQLFMWVTMKLQWTTGGLFHTVHCFLKSSKLTSTLNSAIPSNQLNTSVSTSTKDQTWLFSVFRSLTKMMKSQTSRWHATSAATRQCGAS